MQYMKIATWNVGYGVSPWKNTRILEQMVSIDADIWVLTETHDDLRPPTSGSWHQVSTDQRPQDAEDVKDGSRWATIWSRLPVIEHVRPDYDPVRATAGVIDTPLGRLLIFGTVFPWYHDAGRTVAQEIARQSVDWRNLRSSRGNVSICVAGDLNVNLDGPHYYGSNESKEAVRKTFDDQGLVALTDFSHTGPAQHQKYGLIDHIAISALFADLAVATEVWQRDNARGDLMSDHCGVAIEFSATTVLNSVSAGSA
jgi:endonuclease/exonuclease/phosphatase family metal-dependent hydrolase